jgi:sensor domain CHASE-containing protein
LLCPLRAAASYIVAAPIIAASGISAKNKGTKVFMALLRVDLTTAATTRASGARFPEINKY